MARLTRKEVEEFRRIMREDYSADFAFDDAEVAAEWLARYAEVALASWRKRRELFARLEEEPEGFELDAGSYGRCWVCDVQTEFVGRLWFDRTGAKCRRCFDTFHEGTLPHSALLEPESWMTEEQVRKRLRIRSRKLEAMVSSGKLLARGPGGNGFRMFLLKENPDLRNDAKW
jgi:hypothetical protein